MKENKILVNKNIGFKEVKDKDITIGLFYALFGFGLGLDQIYVKKYCGGLLKGIVNLSILPFACLIFIGMNNSNLGQFISYDILEVGVKGLVLFGFSIILLGDIIDIFNVYGNVIGYNNHLNGLSQFEVYLGVQHLIFDNKNFLLKMESYNQNGAKDNEDFKIKFNDRIGCVGGPKGVESKLIGPKKEGILKSDKSIKEYFKIVTNFFQNQYSMITFDKTNLKLKYGNLDEFKDNINMILEFVNVNDLEILGFNNDFGKKEI